MYFLLAISWLVLAVTSIVLIVKAFKVSPLWGLAVLFLPFAILVFVIAHWRYTRLPVLIQIGTILFIVMLVMLGGEPVERYVDDNRSGESTLEDKQAMKPGSSRATSRSDSMQPSTSRVEGDARDIPLRENARREMREDQDGFPVVVTTLGAEEEVDEGLQSLTKEDILDRLDEFDDRRIRVEFDGGQISEGLVSRDGQWLVVQRRAPSGYFERRIAIADIESLQIVK